MREILHKTDNNAASSSRLLQGAGGGWWLVVARDDLSNDPVPQDLSLSLSLSVIKIISFLCEAIKNYTAIKLIQFQD